MLWLIITFTAGFILGVSAYSQVVKDEIKKSENLLDFEKRMK